MSHVSWHHLGALATSLSALGIFAGAGCASITRPSSMMQKSMLNHDLPPDGKALVCFHRPAIKQGEYMYSNVWDGERFIGDMGSGHSMAYVCDPGKHYFINRSIEVVSVVEAELAVGKTYDLWLNTFNLTWLGSGTLKPIKHGDNQQARVAKWSEQNLWITRGEHSARYIADYEQKWKPEIERIIHDFTTGDKQSRLEHMTAEDFRIPQRTGAARHESPPRLPYEESDTTHDQLIRNLNPANSETVVLEAMEGVEKTRAYDAIPELKKLLADSRPVIRKKAARVVGKLHTDVDETDIKALCAMLKADDPREVNESLKALHRLNAPSAIPNVLSVLKSDNISNVREACRTLAALANKDVIPSIEQLLQHPDPAVRKDATAAIAKLRDKP